MKYELLIVSGWVPNACRGREKKQPAANTIPISFIFVEKLLNYALETNGGSRGIPKIMTRT